MTICEFSTAHVDLTAIVAVTDRRHWWQRYTEIHLQGGRTVVVTESREEVVALWVHAAADNWLPGGVFDSSTDVVPPSHWGVGRQAELGAAARDHHEKRGLERKRFSELVEGIVLDAGFKGLSVLEFRRKLAVELTDELTNELTRLSWPSYFFRPVRQFTVASESWPGTERAVLVNMICRMYRWQHFDVETTDPGSRPLVQQAHKLIDVVRDSTIRAHLEWAARHAESALAEIDNFFGRHNYSRASELANFIDDVRGDNK